MRIPWFGIAISLLIVFLVLTLAAGCKVFLWPKVSNSFTGCVPQLNEYGAVIEHCPPPDASVWQGTWPGTP